ncbi:MAG: hypothetical protein HOY79_24945 [Streptomyces sp.]|nr:hypothetical protein [Streptomyces sp.]
MVEAGKPSLPTGFQEFAVRGKVIGPAVAAAIGAASMSIVNSLTGGAISPFVGAFGIKDPAGYSSCPKGPCAVKNEGEVVGRIRVLWGSVVSASPTEVPEVEEMAPPRDIHDAVVAPRGGAGR